MPTVHVNGVGLYYEVYGEGAPILGIHGTPSSAILWVDAAEELARRGRCIVYDRRGFLRSAGPAASGTLDLSEHVDDAAALLDALAEAPAVVIGRSTGGQVALDVARGYPEKVRVLVLLEPAVFTVDPDATAWAERWRSRVLEAATREPSRAAELVLREALGNQEWEALPAELREMFAATSPAVLAEMRGEGLDLSERPLHLSDEQLGGIDSPTLIVSAEDSPKPLRAVCGRLAQAMPNTETALVSGGHLIDPAHPAVLDFLDRRRKQG